MNDDLKKLQQAALNVMSSEDFRFLMKVHLTNLQNDILDESDQATILKVHSNHTSLREFVEYLKMLSDQAMEQNNG